MDIRKALKLFLLAPAVIQHGSAQTPISPEPLPTDILDTLPKLAGFLTWVNGSAAKHKLGGWPDAEKKAFSPELKAFANRYPKEVQSIWFSRAVIWKHIGNRWDALVGLKRLGTPSWHPDEYQLVWVRNAFEFPEFHLTQFTWEGPTTIQWDEDDRGNPAWWSSKPVLGLMPRFERQRRQSHEYLWIAEKRCLAFHLRHGPMDRLSAIFPSDDEADDPCGAWVIEKNIPKLNVIESDSDWITYALGSKTYLVKRYDMDHWAKTKHLTIPGIKRP